MIVSHSMEAQILGPINIVVLAIIVLFIVFNIGRFKYDRNNPREHSLLLPYHIRRLGLRLSDPLIKFFLKSKISPNVLTISGVLFLVFAAFLFYSGLSGIAAWCILGGGLMDVFDGMIARQTNTISKAGAFLDSTVDRYGEFFLFLGITLFFLVNQNQTMVIIAVVAMVGALLTSYARARGESLGVSCKKGLLQRPERLFLLAIGSGVDPILFFVGINRHWGLIVAVWMIAVLSHITALHRILLIYKGLKDVENKT